MDGALHARDCAGAVQLRPAPVGGLGKAVEPVEGGKNPVAHQRGILPAIGIDQNALRVAQLNAARAGIRLVRHGHGQEHAVLIQHGLVVIQGSEVIDKGVAVLRVGFLPHRRVDRLPGSAVAQYLDDPLIQFTLGQHAGIVRKGIERTQQEKHHEKADDPFQFHPLLSLWAGNVTNLP